MTITFFITPEGNYFFDVIVSTCTRDVEFNFHTTNILFVSMKVVEYFHQKSFVPGCLNETQDQLYLNKMSDLFTVHLIVHMI